MDLFSKFTPFSQSNGQLHHQLLAAYRHIVVVLVMRSFQTVQWHCSVSLRQLSAYFFTSKVTQACQLFGYFRAIR